MFEQDYVMRLIKEMVRAILKLLFNIDTDSPSAELLEDAKEQQTLDELLDMVDNGFINEAENKIYEITEEGKKTDLEMALLFYSYLNDKSDEFLEAHNLILSILVDTFISKISFPMQPGPEIGSISDA